MNTQKKNDQILEKKLPPALLNGYASPILLVKLFATLLLLVWMAVSVSGVFWRLLPQPELQEADVPTSDRAFALPEQSQRPAVNIDSLKAIALFGKEEAPPPITEAEPEPVKEAKLEETTLNLSLVGSFASDNQDRAYAIIAKGQKQELYKVNEEVADLSNVKLLKVYYDRVVLNNKGRQEVLFMYPQGQPISSAAVGVSSNQDVRSSSSPSSRGQDNNRTAAPSSGQRLEKISDAIRFSRKTKNGKMLGFRVLPGRNRQAFEQTGLQLNDVVTAIDGQALDNLRAANQVYQQKRNATQASLTIMRGDEELTVDIDLNNININ